MPIGEQDDQPNYMQTQAYVGHPALEAAGARTINQISDYGGLVLFLIFYGVVMTALFCYTAWRLLKLAERLVPALRNNDESNYKVVEAINAAVDTKTV